MNVVEVKNLKKYYGIEPNIVKAIDGIDFSVDEGEFLAIVGTSGSGKSTMLNLIGGLDVATEGSVAIRGEKLGDMKEEQLTIFRRRNIGFVFQNYNLIPMLNIKENITLPLDLDGKAVDQPYMNKVVDMLGLGDKLQNMPNQLSGGQQQRVAIARALITKPAILLADEPTGNLDSKTTRDVLILLENTNKELKQTIIMITHNLEIAKSLNRVLQIEDGKILAR